MVDMKFDKLSPEELEKAANMLIIWTMVKN